MRRVEQGALAGQVEGAVGVLKRERIDGGFGVQFEHDDAAEELDRRLAIDG